MNFARTETRKAGFDLDKFYDNLNRIEHSLGKPAPRASTSSLSKPTVFKPIENDRVNNFAGFKKDLHSKGLAKGKIKLERPYEKVKMSQATEYEEALDMSDNPILSEQSQELTEDPFERVRTKLQGWKREDREDREISRSYEMGREEQDSNPTKTHFVRHNK